MTEDFKRLSKAELADELAALEERLADGSGDDRVRNLVENLRGHQIELEMQNRELREAHHALEEARDRYATLYDFAPIGYMTLNAQGVIREINLTGARKLGKPRSELLQKPFVTYLEPGQSKAFFKHLRRTFDDDHRTSIELALQSRDGDLLWVSLESIRAHSDGGMISRTAMIDVTARKREEEFRLESEARLALIADNVPVLISYVDAHRRYLYNNAGYERWFGHSRDHIHARHMRDVMGDDAYAAVRHHVDAVLDGEEVHFEAEVPYLDAGTRYVSVSYIPHRNEAREVVGFFALIHDLSERRRAERALAEEQSFVSTVLDTAGALVAVIDRGGHIVRFNRECERVTGYRSAEVTGKHFNMFVTRRDRQAVQEVFESLTDGEFPNTYENYWKTRDGSRRMIAWSNNVLTDDNGRVTHVVATGVDITERRRVENELRHSEQQLRLVTDAVPLLIAYVDRDMRYRFANAAYRDWFGLEPGRMAGHRVDELMEADTFNTLLPFAEQALNGEVVFYENTVHHRSLGTRDVTATLVPDHGGKGKVKGYFSVVMDITERKRTEEADKRRLLEAAHADRLTTMGEMITEIAHELNQPLTAIATTADVCLEQAKRLADEKGGMIAEALGEMSTQARRAGDIIKHVRAFAGRREPELAPVALQEVVNNALSLLRFETRSGGVAIDTAVPGSLMVEADAVLVEQLLVNLARNAVEAMTAAGTESPRLSVSVEENDEAVEICVADNGPGLSVDAREHLFEPFHTSKADGVGLGLAICRSIVEVHGGRMWAGNATDGGAAFYVTLNKTNHGGGQPEPEK